MAVAALIALTVAAPASAAYKYVALGDSYSAGNGTGNPDLDATCSRSSQAYAPIVASQRPDLALTFVACGGAVTSDVQLYQSPSLTSDTKYVTITIGGNDVDFARLIWNCSVINFDCQGAVDNTNSKIKNELPAKLDATYSKIKSKSPTAKVVVLGYPRAFSSTLCSAATNITSSEAVSLNGVADNLDAAIKARVRAAGSNFVYKSAITPFTGHAICASDPWVAGMDVAMTDAAHPTINGYRNGYAPMVRQVIG